MQKEKKEMSKTEIKKYLELCKRCAMVPALPGGIKKVPEELRVLCDGRAYCPRSYEQRYDKVGNVVQLAHLASLTAHEIHIVRLEKVKER